MKLIRYSNKNLPRKQIFKILLTKDCIVFMFRLFDISLWWGDTYADMDYTGR